ncbi:MAG TPA: MerR family transcriptional regulator [Solirubrobacteraceae bacterium]|nr:MerR family transcriptional regulator [Solirubrobacteraceae bacterium]
MRIGELSRRVGVSTDTLRVWERRYGVLKPRRSSGNARLYSAVDEARVRLMQRYIAQRVPPAQAAQLSLGARFTLKPGTREVPERDDVIRARAQLRGALDEFDEASADQALEQMVSEYSTLVVLRDVILPYLRDVGERWATGHATVAQEHFASNFVMFRLASLSRGWDRGLGPLALLACAPDEQHVIGLMCFGIALRQHGWRIAFFGAATPVPTLRMAAAALRPDLIMVCASMPGRLEPHVECLGEIGARWRLALAGVGAAPELASTCHAEYFEDDPVTTATSLAVARDHVSQTETG